MKVSFNQNLILFLTIPIVPMVLAIPFAQLMSSAERAQVHRHSERLSRLSSRNGSYRCANRPFRSAECLGEAVQASQLIASKVSSPFLEASETSQRHTHTSSVAEFLHFHACKSES